jgi:two-component system chemotaxis response regulator CheB
MAAGRRTRVLIVDDSAVMRSLLRSVVCAVPGLEVAGTAADGASALSAVETLRPDLVLLDVEMPVMDGLATLKDLRRRGRELPVIMCSSLTQRGAKVTIEALACGASDYVAKPAGQSSREAAIDALVLDLAPRIHALTLNQAPALSNAMTVQPREQAQGQAQPQSTPPGAAPAQLRSPAKWPTKPQPALTAPAVLVIGVSTGGPAALDVLLPALPGDFPLPVLIVQHMPELFTSLLAERLNGLCHLHVREAAEGDPVCAGTVYIARGNWHMEVLASAHTGAPPSLRLHQGPLENHCRPAADALFRSAANVYGEGVLAVVLTGMGSDGLIGCRIVRDHGGCVLAQDQATSTVWGMPGAVAQAGLANKVLSLNALAPEILRIAAHTQSDSRELQRPAV